LKVCGSHDFDLKRTGRPEARERGGKPGGVWSGYSSGKKPKEKTGTEWIAPSHAGGGITKYRRGTRKLQAKERGTGTGAVNKKKKNKATASTSNK